MVKTIHNDRQARFNSIDSLRGVAAIAVVLFHLSSNLQTELETILPQLFNVIFSHGYLGVPIFFVISGFVISYGIGAERITASYVGNFVLRRSVRLDITYWASIFLAIILLTIKNKVTGSHEELPSFHVIFINMFYLQELLNIKPVISVVYWTLCLEVQLYLFYIFSLWGTQKILGTSSVIGHLAVILPLGIYSICLDLNIKEIGVNGLFVSSWHYFLMGVLVSNVVRGINHSVLVLLTWLMIEISFQYLFVFKAYPVAGTTCCLVIFMMWKFNKLNNFLTGKLFSYLGAISYTLYLVHPDVGWKVISLGKLLAGEHLSPTIALFLLVLGILVSVFVAHIFHVLFEKPTLILSKRLKDESPVQVLKSVLSLNKSN